MKKLFSLGVSFMLAFVLLLIPSIVSAAPAPHLTEITIKGITSDGNNYQWSNTNLSGTKGIIAVYAKGTIRGNYPVIRQGSNVIPTTSARNTELVPGAGGVVIGKIYYLAFDLNRINSGQLSATGQDYYPPYSSLTAFISVKKL
jgi:hypothetical protein